MPRRPRFFHSKSKSLQEQRPAARANMKEGKLNMVEGSLDFTSLLPPKWTSSHAPQTHREDEKPSETEPTSHSWRPSLLEVRHSKLLEIEPAETHNEMTTTIAHPAELSCLQFQPVVTTNYARAFARAVLAAYRSNSFPGASQKDRLYAERVVQGEGRDLVFRPGYVASNTAWDGKDPRLRRAAFTHIFGVTAADCTVIGCPYRGNSCVGCETSGTFEGCRHSHEVSKKLRCSNCEAGTKGTECSVRHHRVDSKDAHQGKNPRPKASRVFFPSAVEVDNRSQSTTNMLEQIQKESNSQGPSQIGPVLNDFFVSRKEDIPSDFDVWMAMRKRAIEYEPGVLAMECRLAKLWSSVLEDELVKQKAAGFKERQ